MTIQMNDGRVVLHHGDSREVLRGMDDASVDAVVCDPPYALVSISKRFAKSGRTDATASKSDAHQRFARGFMGKTWDNEETAFAVEFWGEVWRVLKPGGHVLAFGGTRTYHRLACAVEDAGKWMDGSDEPWWQHLGFEIRDQIGWVYGSGFPKSHNQHGDWEGWGTALKPAWEPIVLARKPLIGTVAANLNENATGAINIDGCRVGMGDEIVITGSGTEGNVFGGGNGLRTVAQPFRSHDSGRWPANIIHDGSDEVIDAFPAAVGQQGYVGPEHGDRDSKGIYGDFGPRPPNPPRVETDKSAARFFYCAKASRADRDAGLDHLPKKAAGLADETSGQHITRRDEGYEVAPRANTHPTVKPTSLMQYLCRLVTPPGGVVLDPFMGSGSTGKAAVLEGFQFIGIEREDEYMPIASARIAWAVGHLARPDVPQPRKPKPANDNQADLFSADEINDPRDAVVYG